MKRIAWIGLLIGLLVLMPGCTKETYEVMISLEGANINNNNVYEDGNIAVGFEPVLDTAISFAVNNKSEQTIRILWDETVFIDIDKSVSKVMHLGVKYIDRDKEMPPTIVPAGTRVKELVVPSKNIYYSSGSGWRTRAIVPTDNALGYDGKTISVFMPIMIGNEKTEYKFDFRIRVAPVPKGV